MTVFTYEKVKRLMDAANDLLCNLVDAGETGPMIVTSDHDDLPKDDDGNPVFSDVFELQQAVDALWSEELGTDALPISGDDTVPVGWDKIEGDVE